MSIQVEGRLEANCKILSVDRGTLKGLYIVKMNCEKYYVEFDIVDTINIFNSEENVKMIIARDKPSYTSKDFCGHGYLFYEKKEGDRMLDQISLYGLIVRIYSDNGLINSKIFNMMDHVYFCVKKS